MSYPSLSVHYSLTGPGWPCRRYPEGIADGRPITVFLALGHRQQRPHYRLPLFRAFMCTLRHGHPSLFLPLPQPDQTVSACRHAAPSVGSEHGIFEMLRGLAGHAPQFLAGGDVLSFFNGIVAELLDEIANGLVVGETFLDGLVGVVALNSGSAALVLRSHLHAIAASAVANQLRAISAKIIRRRHICVLPGKEGETLL